MEEREENDRMVMAEAVESSSDVNKPYALGVEEEKLEIAGTEIGDKCETVTELVESGVGMERDGVEAVDDGGEIIAERSDDPPLEIKVEEETKSVDDGSGDAGLFSEAKVGIAEDELLGERQGDVKTEQELSPVIEDKLEMVSTEVGAVPISSECQMGDGGDETVSQELTIKAEEELAPVIDVKVDVLVTDLGDEKETNDFPMEVEKEGMESLDYKSERDMVNVESVKEEGTMEKEWVDGSGLENDTKTVVAGDELEGGKAGVLAENSEIGTSEMTAEIVEERHDWIGDEEDEEKAGVLGNDSEVGTSEIHAKIVEEKHGLIGDEEDGEKASVLTNDSEVERSEIPAGIVEEKHDSMGDELDEETAGVLANDSEVVTSEIPTGIVEEKHDSVGDELDEETAGVLANYSEVGTSEIPAEVVEEKHDPMGDEVDGEMAGVLANDLEVETSKIPVDIVEEKHDPMIAGDIPIPDVKTNAEMMSQVNAYVGNTSDPQVCKLEYDGSGVRYNHREDKEVDPMESLTSGNNIVEDKDMNTMSLKKSNLDEAVDDGDILGDAVVLEKISTEDINNKTELGVELESTRNAVMEEIESIDAQLATEMEIEAVFDKTRDNDGTMEMEVTPSDVDAHAQENCDSSAIPHDEEDGKLVAEEEMGIQEDAMETETDIADSGKTSGGKRKRGKSSKNPISKASTKGSSRKKVGEDVCFICFEGGELVICNRRGCPKAYHPSCVNRDEAFFKSKGRWNCGWHLCSICEKAARYMCYTCTFSLCKSCIKDAVILCVQGNKGFCETCMETVMHIENKQENKDIQIDFDDKNRLLSLFKDYYIELKAKLSLSLAEINEAKNPWKGADMSGPSKESSEVRTNANVGGSCSDDTTENVEPTEPKRRKVKKKSKTLPKEEELMSTGVEAVGKVIPSSEHSEWASKELIEFVSHVKNGDTSVLTQFDVQALLLEYIKSNQLRDPRKKSQIVCDTRLANLFQKPRVGHFEMLKLLESHFLVRDEQNDDIQGSVVDAENNLVDNDDGADFLTRDGKDRKRKSRKKGNNRGPQSNLDDYAAIDMHNIGLIHLRRKLMEDLLEDADTFHDKVIGSFVRIRISGSTQKQDLYRLVQVIGTSKAPEPYKIGKRTTDIMVEILNLDKTEIVSIDSISNQEFSEEECKRLRQSIKCGLISRLTVGEILDKTMDLQATRVNDWLESETMRLCHLRDRASDLGRRKELRECVEKLQLLKTPNERQRRLEEIPEIHADPKMDPSYESEDNDSETEDNRRDTFMRSRSSSFNRRGREPISPRIDNAMKDSWSGAEKVSSKIWEPSRDLSSIKYSINAGHNGEFVVENSSTLGRDTGRQEANNFSKIISAANSEPAEWAQRSVPRPEPSSGVASGTPQSSSSSARPGGKAIKTNVSGKIWHYQDPSGNVQGPFSMAQLRKWNNTGYFPADLRIWRTTETQANSIPIADALAGKFPKESPAVDTIFPTTDNALQSSQTMSGHSNTTSGTFSMSGHPTTERPSTDQMSKSLPVLSVEKFLGNDFRNLPSPTPKQNNDGSTGVEEHIRTGAFQSPDVNGMLSSPTPVLPNVSTQSAASASVLNSVLHAAAFSSIPYTIPGSQVDSTVSLHAQSSTTREPPAIQMHSNPPPAPQTVQTVTSQNQQSNTPQGWTAGAQPVQPQGYGWNSSNAPNSSGSFSNSGTPSGHQPDVWGPTQSSQANMHPPPATPDPTWAMGPAVNNAPMGVRPDNPNIGWGPVPANPNMGWGNPTAGNPNTNWGPGMQAPPPGNTPGWVGPPGNTGPNVPMVSANPNPGWAPTQNWGPPVQGQAPGNMWGMPSGQVGAPPPPPQGPGLGNAWGMPGGNAGGPPPVQRPPQGNTNQGWVGQPRNQGAWNGEQNHMGGQFSSQGSAQGQDPGFNGGRPWNREPSFGGDRGHRQPYRKADKVCPYNAYGRCKKGAVCDYMHP